MLYFTGQSAFYMIAYSHANNCQKYIFALGDAKITLEYYALQACETLNRMYSNFIEQRFRRFYLTSELYSKILTSHIAWENP